MAGLSPRRPARHGTSARPPSSVRVPWWLPLALDQTYCQVGPGTEHGAERERSVRQTPKEGHPCVKEWICSGVFFDLEKGEK